MGFVAESVSPKHIGGGASLIGRISSSSLIRALSAKSTPLFWRIRATGPEGGLGRDVLRSLARSVQIG